MTVTRLFFLGAADPAGSGGGGDDDVDMERILGSTEGCCLSSAFVVVVEITAVVVVVVVDGCCCCWFPVLSEDLCTMTVTRCSSVLSTSGGESGEATAAPSWGFEATAAAESVPDPVIVVVAWTTLSRLAEDCSLFPVVSSAFGGCFCCFMCSGVWREKLSSSSYSMGSNLGFMSSTLNWPSDWLFLTTRSLRWKKIKYLINGYCL